jgi:hypothetical protein
MIRPAESTFASRRWRRLGRLAMLLLLVAGLGLSAPGCAQRYVSARKVPNSPLVDRLKLTSRKGPRPSPRTMQVLRRFSLEDQVDGDQRRLLARLQEHVTEEPTANNVYALAELSFLAGKRMESRDPRSALDLYGASVAHSYRFLFDPRIRGQRSPFDPQFRADCELYNGALEQCLRLVKDKGALSPGRSHTIESCDHTWEVTVVSRGKGWHAGSFDDFEFASDYDVRGFRNQHRTYGLGVPLIAMRQRRGDGDPLESHYPPGLNFPVTAFLRVLPDDAPPGAGTCRKHRSVLELYDPLMVSELTVAERRVPLESDLTTPLALFLDQGTLASLGTWGLLRPDESQKLRGLYMAQPYEEDKIPVLFVHGL